MKKITLHVDGTHCASCKILIEDILNEYAEVQNTSVDLKSKTISFDIDPERKNVILQKINEALTPKGYTLSEEKKKSSQNDKNTLWEALLLGLSILILFFVLQKSGILNIGLGDHITPATSFLIGAIASISSCLAVVGGLILSLSARIAQDNKTNKKVFVLFHIARIISFTILGGLLGLIGGAIGINFTLSAILGIIASIVMIILGLTLIGVFKKNHIALSAHSFNFFRKIEHGIFAPILIGFGTFFLPCGFTQSMQIQALSSGSFTNGAMIMLFFALGTFPVLALLSFTSISFANSKHAPLFFKTAGVIVIGLGMFALIAGLAGLGVIDPLFNI